MDKWHYIIATIDSEESKVYRNAIEEGSSGGVSSIQTSSKSLSIGHDNDSDRYFPGRIDEVRIYDRALSASEIETLYESGKAKLNSSQTDRLTDGLVGMWSFDGPDISGTTAYDRSGNGNHGTLTNGPQPAIGKVGQALDFDGSDDNVEISDDASHNVDYLTVSFWVKWDSCDSQHDLIIKDYQDRVFAIYMYSATILRFWAMSSNDWIGAGYDVSFDPTIGQWYHIVGTYGETYQRLYIDKVEQYEAEHGGVLDKGSDITFSGGGYDYLDGQLDEVRIYNRALSEDEIQRLYRMGR